MKIAPGDNIRLVTSLGFLAVVFLMCALVFISLLKMQSSNQRLATLVENTNIKTAAAHSMRDAIRMRSISLKKMLIMEDVFDRDEEHQLFLSYAGEYRTARDTLVQQDLDKKETATLNELRQVTRDAQPVNDEAADLLMAGAPIEITSALMNSSEAYQEKVLEQLENLVSLEKENAAAALSHARQDYLETRQTLVIIAVLTILLCLLVATLVIHRVSDKNRQLSYQASHDPLTGLINRQEFEKRVERAISHARATASPHALFFMDLDQFKIVNDTCGHAAGDELLQQLGNLLLGAVRKRDTLGRLGGDEFGMLLENCPLDKAVEIAGNLHAVINGFHFSWGGETFSLGISIGIVPVDRSAIDLASTLSAADSACYIAKESGRNRTQIAHLGDKRLQERHGLMQWVPRITRAIEEDRLALYFQTITPLGRGSRLGKEHIEVLLRMTDDEGKIVSPAVFLPAAEKYGLIMNIDKWVIEKTLAWMKQQTLAGNCPAMVSVNISGQSVGDESMLMFILDQFRKTGVSPNQICFVVTESTAIEDITVATSFMLKLRGYGCRFSLDEFGSGLSSFTYLRKLPVDFLKISGAFVRDMLTDPVDRAMVNSINEIGHLLGRETIAAHIETADVADALRKIGVDYGMGHFFDQPRPLEAFNINTTPNLVLVS